MKLSVVIVNYNVKTYLQQCLRSVLKALEGLEGEVFVVDNQSTDGSLEMVREEFPTVKLLANQENVGFSRANNQAIRASKGEYVLLLNPDTIVGEEVFHTVVRFMDRHGEAGGLGVKMVDGTGRFLPESKRGLPSPTVAFYKIMGLSRLFPRSRTFGRYHLGHLPENEVAQIEILSGACMFLRRKVLDQVGLLDESFFMYGEDIDLSYRITLGGYQNWYFPEARILHYKGESTKKSSVNYVLVFYNAMVIFARKYFTQRAPQLFSFIIRGAIYLSAAAAIGMRFLREALLPLIDLAVVIGGVLSASRIEGLPAPTGGAMALMALGTASVFAVFGAYDIPFRTANLLKGFLVALAGWMAWTWYAGLFSPWFLLLGAAMGAVLVGVRSLLKTPFRKRAPIGHGENANVLAVGSAEEAQAALDLLWQTHYGLGKTLTLDPTTSSFDELVSRVRDLVSKERIHELVFCAADLSAQDTIAMLEALRGSNAVFKISQPKARFIIGPGTTESLTDLLIPMRHAVNSAASRRRRKLLDLVVSSLLLLSLPASIWFMKNKAGAVRNLFAVFTGRATWVGYSRPRRGMPTLQPAVLPPPRTDALEGYPLALWRRDLEYAKDYHVWEDFLQVISRFTHLGTSVASTRIVP